MFRDCKKPLSKEYEMTGLAYTDRWGKQHVPQQGAVIRPRAGAFAVIIAYGKILLSWPKYAPDLPELPGGGIEQGENTEQALIREIEEEAALSCTHLAPEKSFTQQAKFYADFEKEFWDYDQTYWRIEQSVAEQLYFEGERTPEDALKSGWVDVSALPSQNLHAIHKAALRELL